MHSIVNYRDLGGYPCRSGFTRFGKVYRCGITRPLLTGDIEFLRSCGVGTVIDLRGQGEADEMPSSLIGKDGFDYRLMPLFEANPAMIERVTRMSDLYLTCVREFQENFRCILSLISSLDAPLLVHCFLGKDRTGLLCAMLLGAAGVSRENIIADYTASQIFLKPFYDYEISNNTGLLWKQDAAHLGSPAENVACVLDELDEVYGGFEGFFKAIGLTEAEIKGLAAVLS